MDIKLPPFRRSLKDIAIPCSNENGLLQFRKDVNFQPDGLVSENLKEIATKNQFKGKWEPTKLT